MLFSPRNIAIAVAVVGALAFTSVITSHVVARRADSLHESLAVAHSQVKAAVARAEAAEKSDSINRARAAAAEARSDSLSLLSQRAHESARSAWNKFDSLSSHNECDSGCIATARDARSADSVALAHANSALDAERTANARLKLGLDDCAQALSDLKNSATNLDHVSQKIARRPSLLSRLKPDLGAGVAAGLDINGRPNVVTGITLGWHF